MSDFRMPDSFYDPPDEFECECDCDGCLQGACDECESHLFDEYDEYDEFDEWDLDEEDYDESAHYYR